MQRPGAARGIRSRSPGGLPTMLRSRAARLALLLPLLLPLLAAAPLPARAQAPSIDAEVLTYGQDQLPDRIRDFYLRTVGDANAQRLTNLGNVWYQNWSPDA